MKIIDARTGDEVEIGVWAGAADDRFVIKSVRAGLFSAEVTAIVPMKSPLPVEVVDWDPPNVEYVTRLPIRYMHPAFLFQRVLFIPT